ncbi:MAG TPA: flagellar export protein FliJ [Pseudomonadales bacterium]|nr:flagellar export protein FliJ [Pseudomonadales bacterium]
MSIHERIRRFGGLIKVYRRREEGLARRLRDADTLARREQAALKNIEGIKAEYQQGLTDAGRNGASAKDMKNWSRFVRNLDAVHAEQVERTRRADDARTTHRDAWITQHKRVKGFETLHERLVDDRDAGERRVEQRHMDEMAGRARREDDAP